MRKNEYDNKSSMSHIPAVRESILVFKLNYFTFTFTTEQIRCTIESLTVIMTFSVLCNSTGMDCYYSVSMSCFHAPPVCCWLSSSLPLSHVMSLENLDISSKWPHIKQSANMDPIRIFEVYHMHCSSV